MKRYPKYKDSGVPWLGQVPEHWEVKRLKRVFFETREKALQGDEQLAATQKYGVVSQAQFMKDQDQKLVLALKGTENFKHVEKDDFVISLRAFEGGIERSSQPGCVSPAYTVIRSKGSATPAFAARLLKTPEFISQISMTYDGIREGKAIKFKDAGPVPLPIPPLSEQACIDNFLDGVLAKMDSAIASQEKMIELLKERRSAIITQAVTKGLDPKAKMKDSGVPWLGQVPAHWGVTLIGRLFSVELGKMLQTSKSDEADMLIPYLRSANIQWGSAEVTDVKEMWFSRSEIKKLKLETDDLLVCEGGDVGRSCLWRGEIELCGFQNSVIRVRGRGGVHISHTAYWVRFLKEKGYVDMVCNKSTIAHFTAEKVARAPYLSMPQADQILIARYLDTEVSKINTAIQSQERMIELLKERRSAIITQAVTGQIDVR